MNQSVRAVVLAAGRGTRLVTEGCDLPKVMRLALGKPLLGYVLDALSFLPREDVTIVVGYKKEDVCAHFGDYRFAVQEPQLGTGHAVKAAEASLSGFGGAVLVCYGDMPLITRDTYEGLIAAHLGEGNACTILTGTAQERLPFGRIVRNRDGAFLKIVEDRDCTDAEREITELNSGVYVFSAPALFPALSQLRRDNAQSEYYLTDVPPIIRRGGGKIGICKRALGAQIIGVNTIEQLKQAEDLLREGKQGE